MEAEFSIAKPSLLLIIFYLYDRSLLSMATTKLAADKTVSFYI